MGSFLVTRYDFHPTALDSVWFSPGYQAGGPGFWRKRASMPVSFGGNLEPQVRRIRVSGKDMVQIARFWESRSGQIPGQSHSPVKGRLYKVWILNDSGYDPLGL
ncbi:hypothetical protein DSO57_1014056 [Entomophthora muscae]|uniref:Uncharacterized protein n=1 Tax=Entomophthora muscae TaxID=34485 RepID=A0ACC2SUP6_9FUNG|nr:hypothetical protein DSO57_1014056 [Entomophthora muscae]